MGNNQLAVRVLQTKDNLKAVFENPDFQEALACVASKYMTSEKIMKVALLATSRNPDLFACTQASVLNAIITASEMGLDFGGASGQGYLIAYNNKNYPDGVKECKFMPGYQGFVELAYRNKQITYIDAQVVYEKDTFDYDLGSDPFVKFKPYLSGERGKLLCAFALARLKDADRTKIEILPATVLEQIRNSSRAKDDGPWKWWPSEMQRKSGIRRLWKYLPKTPEMVKAIEADNEMYRELGDGAATSLAVGVAGLKDRIASQKEPEALPPPSMGPPASLDQPLPSTIGKEDVDKVLDEKKREQADAPKTDEAEQPKDELAEHIEKYNAEHSDEDSQPDEPIETLYQCQKCGLKFPTPKEAAKCIC